MIELGADKVGREKRLDWPEVETKVSPSAFPFPVDWVLASFSVRHAGPEVLADVPREPVIREGSFVTGRVPYKLIEESDGWEYRPNVGRMESTRLAAWGLMVPLVMMLSVMASVFLHEGMRDKGMSWPVAIAGGIALGFLGGGFGILLFRGILKMQYELLCRLRIPREGGDLELDLPKEPKEPAVTRMEALKWAFGTWPREVMRIPRSSVRGVQLCFWRFKMRAQLETSITFGVQGVLALREGEEGEYVRVPILLTADFAAGAQMMRKLGDLLAVPFLFCVLPEDVEVGVKRSKERPALRTGGYSSF